MGAIRKWTQEEIDYLCEAWGQTNTATICRHLGRSLGGVRKMAYTHLRLGRPERSGEKINAAQIYRALRGQTSNRERAWEMLQKRGMRMRRLRNVSRDYWMVAPEDMWSWIRDNLDWVNFDCFEAGMLGPEPDWMQAERAARKGRRPCRTRWTPAEEEQLRREVEADMPMPEICARHGRTEKSVREKIPTTGKLRLSKREPVQWTEQDNMRLAGYARAGYHETKIVRLMGVEGRISADAMAQKIDRLMRNPFYGDW